jgi:type II secretory ATPase GspE/PulE/Tfp pilus assembly ATPase PilB-like protein
MTDAKTRLANRERQRKYREAHRDEINEQRKERYNNRIKKGKCPRCGGKVKKGYTLCTDCCEYQADLNRKYAKQRKKTKISGAGAKKAKVSGSAAKKGALKKNRAGGLAAKKPPLKRKLPKRNK